ncbi:hypothetical protein [Nostoc commune]|uniref:hypothetical protein n=1 Tax=Nostoc commune TaxID=1178 RepID=UPI0018C60E5C|nr:hypothetical protein [Nostoc commune]MBG1262876.1 hypothetical protein [Nostoc commune BAE]
MSLQSQISLPAQIGILLGDLGEVNIVALKYLIIHLNTLQSDFEFEFFPITDRQDPVLRQMSKTSEIERSRVRAELPGFLERTRTSLSHLSQEYKLSQAIPPDKFILLTMARFNDNYYFVRVAGMSVLALGNWERHMAPPSLLEFFVTLVLRQAVSFVSPSLKGSVHLGTKGCLFDFTHKLEDVRLKTLQGFICSDCQASLATDGHAQLAEHLLSVLDTSRWLGKTEDPTTPAGIVSNLGYDLFKTKGVKPNLWEKTQAILREEGVKELIKLIGGITLAALLLWLGLKK